jgi:hypothetical protein
MNNVIEMYEDNFTYKKIKESVDEDGYVIVCTCESGMWLFESKKKFYIWCKEVADKEDYMLKVPFEIIRVDTDGTPFINSDYERVEVLSDESK